MLVVDITEFVVDGVGTDVVKLVGGVDSLDGPAGGKSQGQEGVVAIDLGDVLVVGRASLVPLAGTEHNAALLYASQSSSFHEPSG